jgi:hypothetical protein
MARTPFLRTSAGTPVIEWPVRSHSGRRCSYRFHRASHGPRVAGSLAEATAAPREQPGATGAGGRRLAPAMVAAAAGLFGKSLTHLCAFTRHRPRPPGNPTSRRPTRNTARIRRQLRRSSDLRRTEALPGVTSVGLTENGVHSPGMAAPSGSGARPPWHGEHNDVPHRQISSGCWYAGCTCCGGALSGSRRPVKTEIAIINRAFAKPLLSGRGIHRQASGVR